LYYLRSKATAAAEVRLKQAKQSGTVIPARLEEVNPSSYDFVVC
jgi:hypothetical protein